MARESQNAWVLRKLEAGARLSSLDAVVRYGIQDLPKMVSELRRSGVAIESKRVDGTNRHGRRTHWLEYWIEK